MKRFVPFGEPSLGEEEIREVTATLRSGWIGMGPRVRRFEEAFAAYVGAKDAVAVSSCTAALHLSLVVRNVGPGDEVITTPMTFAATANTIVQVGATPVLVDVDPRSLNLTPQGVAAAVTDRTRAILPVHFGGLPVDLEGMAEVADRHHLAIIEDAAHAVGARYHGRRVGGWGHLACFSFYPNKNITTIEGGMITVEDPAVADRLRRLRLHGLGADAWERFQTRRLVVTEVVELGFKYNMTDVQAALGLHQLHKIERFLRIRERYARLLDRTLAPLVRAGILSLQYRPPLGGGDRHALHLYVVLLNLDRFRASRDEVVLALRARNVGAAVHYQAIHQHPFYRARYRGQPFPVAERIAASTLSLPLSPRLTAGEMSRVAGETKAVLEELAH